MSDLISKQDAIEALAELARKRFTIQDYFQIYLDALTDADIKIRQLPSALGTNLADVGTDCISRQVAIDAVNKIAPVNTEYDCTLLDILDVRYVLTELPTAQPEIIRCGQCKYAEEADSEDNQDGYTCQFHRGSIWFSGSYCSWAERRHDE